MIPDDLGVICLHSFPIFVMFEFVCIFSIMLRIFVVSHLLCLKRYHFISMLFFLVSEIIF